MAGQESVPAGADEVQALAAAARGAPAAPGVYLFLSGAGEVLYVGKATHLRRRLRQHATAGSPTSHLHRRYALVRRVVWELADSEEAAAWSEADLIHALRPPFNASPGLRPADPTFGAAPRPPFLVVAEGEGATMRFTLEPEPDGGRVYGCFPHLGKGVSSRLGIACSDGYVALLRLLWAASGEGTHTPAGITRSAPTVCELAVEAGLRPGLHRLLSGVSAKVLPALRQTAASRPEFMQPALLRDEGAATGFYAAGPRRLRELRLRHGIRRAPVDDETHRRMIIHDLESSVGRVAVATPPIDPA